MPLYRAYGLTIDSALELPELVAIASDAGSAEGASSAGSAPAPDIRIRYGAVPAHGLEGGQQLGPFLWADPANIWLHIPGVARFLATGGHTITIDPDGGVAPGPTAAPAFGSATPVSAHAARAATPVSAPAARAPAPAPTPDPDSIRVFLLGSALGAALGQRGLLVLHGNAVQVGDACMCAVGHSGVGKSTLAAGFWRRGHAVLADDVVAVDRDCRALPGFPRIKLWQDSADHLKVDTAPLRRVRPDANKFNLPVPVPADTPLPLRWVYILDVHTGPDLRMEPVTGLARFAPLHNNTYRVRFLEGMSMKGEHLRLCGQLAGRIRLVKVMRPASGFSLDALMDALLADMAEHPAGGQAAAGSQPAAEP